MNDGKRFFYCIDIRKITHPAGIKPTTFRSWDLWSTAALCSNFFILKPDFFSETIWIKRSVRFDRCDAMRRRLCLKSDSVASGRKQKDENADKRGEVSFESCFVHCKIVLNIVLLWKKINNIGDPVVYLRSRVWDLGGGSIAWNWKKQI